MCGIFGYTGDKPAASIMLEALGRLEYRGYDSAGVATECEGKIHVGKDTGQLSTVAAAAKLWEMPGCTGIGHVRWATHGGITKNNAHPHCDVFQQIAVVHNGIIENYTALRERLSSKYTFLSDTDTEVIPHLLREHINTGVTFQEAFFQTLHELKGCYALLIVTSLQPGKIFAARQGSPLVIGIGEKSNYAGSDAISFLPYTYQAVYLEDGEMAVITPENIRVFDSTHRDVVRIPEKITGDGNDNGKDDYDHYMIKEINEQPQAISQAIMQDENYLISMAHETLRCRNIIFTACGTSRFAALIGRHAFSSIGHVSSEVVMASEFGYCTESVDNNSLVYAISQSGETADVLDIVRQAKKKGATIFSLVNAMNSSLARLSDRVLYLNCGPEIGVAATKSFISEVSLLYLLAFAVDHRFHVGQTRLKFLSTIIECDLPWYVSEIPAVAERLKDKNDFYFLAQGVNYAMAREGALKFSELAHVHAEGIASGEFKYNTLDTIYKGTPVIAICPTDYTYMKTIADIQEAKYRGAYIVGISNVGHVSFDEWIQIPKVEEVMYPLVTAVPLQLLAYYSATYRSQDPNKYSNLVNNIRA